MRGSSRYRAGRYELSREGMLRPLEHIGCTAALNDRAITHDEDLVTDLRDDAEIV